MDDKLMSTAQVIKYLRISKTQMKNFIRTDRKALLKPKVSQRGRSNENLYDPKDVERLKAYLSIRAQLVLARPK